MDKIADQLSSALAQIAGLTEKYGPKAVDLALEIARLAAIKHLLLGFIFAGVTFAGIKLGCWFWQKPQEWWCDNEPGPHIGIAAILFLTTFAGLTAAFSLTTLSAWVGIFRPEIWLASQIWTRAMSQ